MPILHFWCKLNKIKQNGKVQQCSVLLASILSLNRLAQPFILNPRDENKYLELCNQTDDKSIGQSATWLIHILKLVIIIKYFIQNTLNFEQLYQNMC